MNRDFVFASLTLALAVVYYLMADAIPTSLLSDAVGPGGLPKAYALIMAGLSVILMAQSLAKQRRLAARGLSSLDEAGTVRLQWAQIYRALGLLAIGFFYVLVVPWLGYIPTLAVLIAGTCYYQGGTLGPRVGVTALIGALFFWVLFVLVLRIPQPPGIWPELF
jgi:hypothetical protein